MSAVGKVDADLVGAAGFQLQLEQGVVVELLAGLVVGAGVPAAGDYSHSLAVARVAGDGGVNDALRRRHNAYR